VRGGGQTLSHLLPIDEIVEVLTDEYKKKVSIAESVVFIPENRSLLEYLNEERSSFIGDDRETIEVFLDKLAPPMKSFVFNMNEVKEKMRENQIQSNFILDLISFITGTKVEVTDPRGRIVFKTKEKVLEPFYASAMINEVTNILLPLLDLSTPSLVLVEDPEAHLHLAYQILISLGMLSLVQHGYKFVMTTHSDTFVAFLGALVRYKPDEDNLLHLLQEIFGEDIVKSEFLKKLIKDVINTIRNNSIKIYYFEGGKIEERDPTMINFDVPGMTKKVIDKIALWEFDEEEKLYKTTNNI